MTTSAPHGKRPPSSTRRGIGRSLVFRAALFSLALAAVAVLGAIPSGCGGSDPEGVAQVETTETTTGSSSQSSSSSADPAAFSSCMRSHGLPNFPDPDANGRIPGFTAPGRIEDFAAGSAQARAAEKACQKFMPSLAPEEPARVLEEVLRYSACMREHGVPKFPDPKLNAQGEPGLSLDGIGVDPNSPRFKAAEDACKQLEPGANGDDSEGSEGS